MNARIKPLRVSNTIAHSPPATCRLRRRTNQRLRFLGGHAHGPPSESTPMPVGSACAAALIGTIANALARSTQLEQGFAVALQFLIDATQSTLVAVDLLRGDALPPLRVELNRAGSKLPHFEGDSRLILAISRITRPVELSPLEADRVLGGETGSRFESEDVVVAPIGGPLNRRGLLWLERPQRGFSKEAWREFADGVASQVSLGLERRQAEAELSEHARLAALFADVSIALASTAALEVCLDRCTEAIRKALGASVVRVWLLGDGRSSPGLAVSSFASDVARSLQTAVNAASASEIEGFLREHQSAFVRDAALASRDFAQRHASDLTAFVAHPLAVEGKLLGVIGSFSQEPLSDTASAALLPIADAIAVGIQRKLLEKEQSELQAQLLQAQKMEAIGRLSGGIAHDFNNLLAVILSCSALLLESLPEEDARRADVLDIQHAGDRAAALTRQLLAFSRKLVVEPRVVAVNTIIRDVQKMLSRLIGEDIELVIQLGATDGSIKADPGQLEQLIMNLAVNARDAMPGGGRLSISTANVVLEAGSTPQARSQEHSEYVRISVVDTGCGMDEATRERIFEPFFTTKPAGKGTGLGLSTVYGIVAQSGGFVHVESALGAGSSFHIYFPSFSREQTSAARAVSRDLKARPGETILLVEDESGVRAIAARILRARGYEVIETADAGGAIDAIEQSQISVQLLLSDMVMPGGNGPELAELVRGRFPELKVLFMSGHTDHPAVASGSMGGGTGFLHKPFTPETLATKVRELLDS